MAPRSAVRLSERATLGEVIGDLLLRDFDEARESRRKSLAHCNRPWLHALFSLRCLVYSCGFSAFRKGGSMLTRSIENGVRLPPVAVGLIARRTILAGGLALVAGCTRVPHALATAGDSQQPPETMAAWMDQWMAPWQELARRGLKGPLWVSRFRDPVYFLLRPIGWTANTQSTKSYAPVDVPVGFVTDFASIPKPFYSLLRPDGDYAYAAVIHDYVYWTQDRTREECDTILMLVMQELSVADVTTRAIYTAVRTFGNAAWQENATLRANGERRVLTKIPCDPVTLWADWKKRSEVFSGTTIHECR